MEPFMLRKWRLDNSFQSHFFTCARPGRSRGKKGRIPDDIVSNWVRRLPGPDTAIISLLGCKPEPKPRGISEFSYYSYSGGFDDPSERRKRPSFQEWLDQRHARLQILVREHPTFDQLPIPVEVLEAIASDFNTFMAGGRTLVIVDSGGSQRTGAVAKYNGGIEVPSNKP